MSKVKIYRQDGYVELDFPSRTKAVRISESEYEQLVLLGREADKWKSICGCPMCTFHKEAYALKPTTEPAE